MYRRPRIIPSLLLQEGGLVKTQKFDKPRYLGAPVNAVKIFNNKGVDELCILDISAPRTGGEPDYDLLHDIATEAFMPLSYGGGVHSLEQIQRLFAIGYEKVILNTALVETPDLIREAVAYAGSQSIVASIDVKTDVLGRSFCYVRGGREKQPSLQSGLPKGPRSWELGRILLGSINRDGQMKGYDLSLVRSVADARLHPGDRQRRLRLHGRPPGRAGGGPRPRRSSGQLLCVLWPEPGYPHHCSLGRGIPKFWYLCG